jgi:hypothetical protein
MYNIFNYKGNHIMFVHSKQEADYIVSLLPYGELLWKLEQA